MTDYHNPTDHQSPSTHYCAVCSDYMSTPYELRMDDGRGGILRVSLCGEHARALADRIRKDLEELVSIDKLVKDAEEGSLFEETELRPCVIPQVQTLTIQGPPELMATVKSVTIEFKEEASE